MSHVVEQYFELWKQLATLRSEFKRAENELTAKLDEIESRLLLGMEATGQDVLVSYLGEVKRVQTVRFRCDDWGSFSAYILEHRAPNLFAHHLNQANLRRFVDGNNGEIPAGLTRHLDVSLRVRSRPA